MTLLEKLRGTLTAQNVFLDENTGGKGKYFKARFLQPGLVKYSFGVCLLEKETIDRFVHSFVGCPVIIGHKDVTNDNAKELSCGNICHIWYDNSDGWYWCDGIIDKEEALDKINQGYNVSCQYEITEYANNTTGALHNGNAYDKVILNGKPEHLAIVDKPRYENAFIAANALDLTAENEDKWITIKPNGEEGKGKHLLLKDGETPKEAIERTYGNGEKSDTKDDLVDNPDKRAMSFEEYKRRGDIDEKRYRDSIKGLINPDGSLKVTKSDTKDKQSESKGDKKYNYTLTKKEVEDRKMLGGMADTGNYYTNGYFAIDKKYLNIKGQEPTKNEEIEKSLKHILKGDSTDRYTPVKDFEIGELKREYGKPIKVAKYSYFDEKVGYERNIYLDKKYNDLFKNFDLKFGGETEPVFAYKGKDIVGVVMPIMARGRSYSKASNSENEEEVTIDKNQLKLKLNNSLEQNIIIEAINEIKDTVMFKKLFRKDSEMNKDEMKELFMECIQDVLKASNEEDKEDDLKNPEEKEEKAENKCKNEAVDKRKLIDEVAGIMKSAGCDDEDIRTAIAKMEKIGYDESEADKADNCGKKSKNEDVEVEEDKKEEEEKEAKNKAKNALEEMKSLFSQSQVSQSSSKYFTKSDAIELGNELF